MPIFDPAFLTALAALISATASLVWALRRKPDREESEAAKAGKRLVVEP